MIKYMAAMVGSCVVQKIQYARLGFSHLKMGLNILGIVLWFVRHSPLPLGPRLLYLWHHLTLLCRRYCFHGNSHGHFRHLDFDLSLVSHLPNSAHHVLGLLHFPYLDHLQVLLHGLLPPMCQFL